MKFIYCFLVLSSQNWFKIVSHLLQDVRVSGVSGVGGNDWTFSDIGGSGNSIIVSSEILGAWAECIWWNNFSDWRWNVDLRSGWDESENGEEEDCHLWRYKIRSNFTTLRCDDKLTNLNMFIRFVGWFADWFASWFECDEPTEKF